MLTNCAIYYNAALLNRLLEKAERNGDVKLCELIKHLSLVASTHINFQGKYELFLQMEGEAIDLDAMILHFDNFKFMANQLIIL